MCARHICVVHVYQDEGIQTPYRVWQGVEHGAVIEDQLRKGSQAGQSWAPGRAIWAHIA